VITDPFSYRDNPAVPVFPDDHPIIIYDGKCRMCSGFVRFILRHDKRDCFRFIAVQSPLGTALCTLTSSCYSILSPRDASASLSRALHLKGIS
jgi:hypothetical protein